MRRLCRLHQCTSVTTGQASTIYVGGIAAEASDTLVPECQHSTSGGELTSSVRRGQRPRMIDSEPLLRTVRARPPPRGPLLTAPRPTSGQDPERVAERL